MDFSAFYSTPQQPFTLYPPTPHADFEADSPPQNGFGHYDHYRRYDDVQTPANSQRGILQSQPLDADHDMHNGRQDRSSSEEKELTPAQSRRKEQNRQAQRAFRERKEKAFKDLESKLATMEASSTNIMSENEMLRQELQKFKQENEILRATSKMATSIASISAGDLTANISVGPMRYNPTEFYDNLLQTHANKTPSHRIVLSPGTNERLLGAGATWDLIVGHPLYKQGLVDVTDVCEKLKGMAKCDGQGPVFEEGFVLRAIAESAASGNDELI